MPRKPTFVYQPTVGLKNDFEKIINLFTATDSVRYEQFAEIWRNLKFSLISSGRQTERETREFFEECFKIAIPYWLPPYTFQVRVGGLYLLYGLYNIQMVVPKVRIRLTCSQWKEIKIFKQEAIEQKHSDVVYIFRMLWTNRAFHFVVLSSELYPTIKDTDQTVSDDFKEERNTLSQTLTTDIFDQLFAVDDQYRKMKIALAGPDSCKPERSLDMINLDITGNLKSIITTHNQRLNASLHSGSKRRRDSESDETDYDSHADTSGTDWSPGKGSVGQRRTKLKSRAFSQVSKASKSRRHRQTQLEIASPIKSPPVRKSIPRSAKKSSSEKESEDVTYESFDETPDENEDSIAVNSNTVCSMPSLVDDSDDMPLIALKQKKTKRKSIEKTTSTKSSAKKKKVKHPQKHESHTEQFPDMEVSESVVNSAHKKCTDTTKLNNKKSPKLGKKSKTSKKKNTKKSKTEFEDEAGE